MAQASSNVVKEGTCRPGDLIHSQTKETLVGKGHKLEILPILVVGSWVVTGPKPVGGGFSDFIRKEVVTADNDSDQWKIETFEDGKPVVRNKVLSFLVLPVSRVNGFPFFVDFGGTNKNGGKLLSTIIQENSFRGLPAPGRVVELSTALKTYKTNSWFVVNVQPTRDSSKEELAYCRKWYDIFCSARLKAEGESEEDNGID